MRSIVVIFITAMHVFSATAFVQSGITSFEKNNVYHLSFKCTRNKLKPDTSTLRCMQPGENPSDGIMGSLFKALFPSAEERRKEEVRRRRKWMPKQPSSFIPETPRESSPAVNNYVPPEQSESGKVDIGMHAH